MIREIRAKDFEGLSRLIHEVYSENPKAMKFSSMPTESELKVLLDYKLALLGRGEAVDYVAIDGGRVVAECDVAIGNRSTIGIIIERSMRRKGLGRALLDRALKRAKGLGANSVIAEIHEDNAPALKFFSNNGFSYIGDKSGGERIMLLRKML